MARRAGFVIAMLASALVPSTQGGAQPFDFEGRIEGLGYPTEREIGSAESANLRGALTAGTEVELAPDLGAEAEVSLYGDVQHARFVDGVARLHSTLGPVSVEAGLLRNEWGRTDDSRLNMLVAPNTVFSLAEPEEPVSQPGAHAWGYLGNVRIDAYALGGIRGQPLPEEGSRFDFGVPAEATFDGGTLGSGALAGQLSGSTLQWDWALHGFYGLTRRPAYVRRIGPRGQPRVAVLYEEVGQVGGELETSLGSWRLWTEGFVRADARDRTGERVTLGHVAAAAEYQVFGALSGAFDVFTELRGDWDSRGDDADRPFATAATLTVNAIQTSRLPVEVELSGVVDLAQGGTGQRLRVQKTIAESPVVRVGAQLLTFQAGASDGLLNVFEDDTEGKLYLEWEF